MYGAETWTLRKADVKRLEACEMWFWRRMERISWTERRTNEDVLILVQEERSIMKIIKKRQKTWIGHILRHNNLLRDVIEGRMDGKRSRGRKRIMMLDDMRRGKPYGNLKRRAEDRDRWRHELWTCP